MCLNYRGCIDKVNESEDARRRSIFNYWITNSKPKTKDALLFLFHRLFLIRNKLGRIIEAL